MLGHADRSHPRSTAAMRNAKRFVQVQVTDIRPEVGRATKADLRVQTRAVHVTLSAELMDDVAYLFDVFLEHAVRGWISDHQTGEVVVVGLGFDAQVAEVDVASLSQATATTFRPAITALAGLVPCAE